VKFATSSTAFRNFPIEKTIQIAEKANLALEFSSGLPYKENMTDMFLNASMERLPHNYFPAPKDPFVLNLASLDDAIWEKSVDHCAKNLELAAQVNAPFYSVHAGYCVDPHPSNLGKGFSLKMSFPRSKYWEKFLGAIEKLATIAEKLGVGLHIENNVVTKQNLIPGGSSPLLCADPDECSKLITEMNLSVLGLHLDTGHLKVSANTFNFSKSDFISKLGDYICSIHHSENFGEDDTNDPIDMNYWFLEHMKSFKNAYHILEVHDQSLPQIYEQFELLKKAAN
jgi:sugar phosphate isomerase/epimerase